ncbi:murein biosynthesis integral membrane protein MurJ [Ruoffia sp. FAM 20858]|uniref:murein biosynthesis integral membrane protein MurJ n=1 Tax=Ruoffia sp. FAM 20858 TaxID=3259516 RepID=UPI00388A5ED5
MSQTNKTAKSVLIIMIFTISSKVLGFVREALIAAKFGSGPETDAFFVAMTATSLFSALVSQSLNTTMIPILSEVEVTEKKHGKIKHTNNILNSVVLVSLLIILVAWILSPIIIRILANGFEGEQFNLAVTLTRIGLPVILFAGILGVFRGYLQSELKFFETGISEFPFNFIYIFFLIFFAGNYGIRGLMIASVLAVASQIVLQIPALKNLNFKYKLVCNFKDKYILKMVHLVPPILIGVAINDINKIVDRSLASTLVEGSISALNYATRLDNLVIGIFVTAILTVLFPTLSQKANDDNHDSLKKLIKYAVNIIIIITVPATIGIIVLANPIVKIAFERGVFDSNATYMTTGALIFYSVGLVGTSVKMLLYKIYYSLQDTRTPMIDGFITVFFNVVFNFILINFMAHRGLAFATSIAISITSIFLLVKLKRKIGDFGLKSSISCMLKSFCASLIMGLIVYVAFDFLTINLSTGTLNELIILLISIALGTLAYILIMYLFKIEELEWALGLIKNRIKTLRRK